MDNEFKEPDYMLDPFARDKRFPDLKATGIFMLAVLAGYIILQVVLIGVLAVTGSLDSFNNVASVQYGVNAVFELVCMGVPVAIMLGMYRKNIPYMLRLNSMTLKQLIYVVLIGICGFVANTLLTQANLYAATFFSYVSLPEVPPVISGMDKLMYIFALVIVAPITEEIIMRGVIMRGLEGSSKWFSIIITGVFFAMLHLSYYTIVPKVLMGIMLCYVVYITNSLYAGIIVHMLNNGILVLIDLASSGVTEDAAQDVVTDVNLLPASDRLLSICICVMFSIGFIAAIIGLLFALRKTARVENADGTYTYKYCIREKLQSEQKFKLTNYIFVGITFACMVALMFYLSMGA